MLLTCVCDTDTDIQTEVPEDPGSRATSPWDRKLPGQMKCSSVKDYMSYRWWCRGKISWMIVALGTYLHFVWF